MVWINKTSTDIKLVRKVTRNDGLEDQKYGKEKPEKPLRRKKIGRVAPWCIFSFFFLSPTRVIMFLDLQFPIWYFLDVFSKMFVTFAGEL